MPRKFYFSFKAYITRWPTVQTVLRNSHTIRSLLDYCPRDIKTQRPRFVSTCFADTASFQISKCSLSCRKTSVYSLSPKSCTSHIDNGFTWLEGHICLLVGLWCRSYTGASGYFDRCCHFHSRHL